MKRKHSIEERLRELVRTRGLRKVASDLGIDHGSLFRSLQNGSNIKLNRIEDILDLFGYELKIIRKSKTKRRERKS
jgi:DNA-binding phage protein